VLFDAPTPLAMLQPGGTDQITDHPEAEQGHVFSFFVCH